MKIGEAGEAFFVFETENHVPEELRTSPLAGPSQPLPTEEVILVDVIKPNYM
jgi:phosphatidate phosphatase PAH1